MAASGYRLKAEWRRKLTNMFCHLQARRYPYRQEASVKILSISIISVALAIGWKMSTRRHIHV